MRKSQSLLPSKEVQRDPSDIPRLGLSDVKTGKVLGEGVYGIVYAVAAFNQKEAFQSIQQSTAAAAAAAKSRHDEDGAFKRQSLMLLTPAWTTRISSVVSCRMERRQAVVLDGHFGSYHPSICERDEILENFSSSWTMFHRELSLKAIPQEEEDDPDLAVSQNHDGVVAVEKRACKNIYKKTDCSKIFHEDTTTTAACDDSDNYDDPSSPVHEMTTRTTPEVSPVSIQHFLLASPDRKEPRNMDRRKLLATFRNVSSRGKFQRHEPQEKQQQPLQEQYPQQQQKTEIQLNNPNQRNCSTLYAIKCVKHGLPWIEEASFAHELAKEAALLSLVSHHPNICTLRATVGRPGSATFQMVLDRLSMTLEDKLMLWSKKERQRRNRLQPPTISENNDQNSSRNTTNCNNSSHHRRGLFRRSSSRSVFASSSRSLMSSMSNRSLMSTSSSASTAAADTYNGYSESDPNPMMCERLQALYDVAQALRFLHSRRILYRDLKPANIGVKSLPHTSLNRSRKSNNNGIFQLFDFGSARLVPTDKLRATRRHDLDDYDDLNADLYHLTGMTGTRRYMAPEVARSDPYGFSADVYSFAILFWTVMALHKAYHHFHSAEEHYAAVVEGGERPDVNVMMQVCPHLPYGLQQMLTVSWDACPSKRPSFQHICQCIEADNPAKKSSRSNDK